MIINETNQFKIIFTFVCIDSPLFEEMHLLPEPLFVYPSDNVHMCVFNGTEDGRIFLGGKDGAVYEFAYRVGACLAKLFV